MNVDFFETLDPTEWHTGKKKWFSSSSLFRKLDWLFPYVFTIERYCTLVIFNKIAYKSVILWVFSMTYLLGWKENIKLHDFRLYLPNVYYHSFIIHSVKCTPISIGHYSDFQQGVPRNYGNKCLVNPVWNLVIWSFLRTQVAKSWKKTHKITILL